MAVGGSEFAEDLSDGGEGSGGAGGGVAVSAGRRGADEAAGTFRALDGAGLGVCSEGAGNFTTNADGADEGLRGGDGGLRTVVAGFADGAGGHSGNCPCTVGASDHRVLCCGWASEASRADVAASLASSREGTDSASNWRLKAVVGGRAGVSDGADGAVGARRGAVVAAWARNLEVLVDGGAVVSGATNDALELATSRSCSFSATERRSSEGVGEGAGPAGGATSAVGGTSFGVSSVEAANGRVECCGTGVAGRAVVADGFSEERVVSGLAGNRCCLVSTAHAGGAEVARGGTDPRIRSFWAAKGRTVGCGAHEAGGADAACDARAVGAGGAGLEHGDGGREVA